MGTNRPDIIDAEFTVIPGTAAPGILAPSQFHACQSIPLSCRRATPDEAQSKRELDFVISTEEPVEHWWGKNILLHTAEAVDLAYIQKFGAFLLNHDPSLMLGQVINSVIAGGKNTATAKFDDDELGEMVRQKVNSGSLRGASIRFMVDAMDEIDEGVSKDYDGGRLTVTGPAFVTTRWSAIEYSLTPIPADAAVELLGQRALDRARITRVGKRVVFDFGRGPTGRTGPIGDPGAKAPDYEPNKNSSGAPPSLDGASSVEPSPTSRSQESPSMPDEKPQAPTAQAGAEQQAVIPAVNAGAAVPAHPPGEPGAQRLAEFADLLLRARALGLAAVIEPLVADPSVTLDAARQRLLDAVAPVPAAPPAMPAEPGLTSQPGGGSPAARSVESLKPGELSNALAGL